MDSEDSGAHRPPTWHEQHGATILGGVLAFLFIIVLLTQMVC